jgi:hypothetical protein
MSTLVDLTTTAVPDLALVLDTQPEPERRVTWRLGWGTAVTVRSVEHLTVLMSLIRVDDFGGLCHEGDDEGRWAQAKRLSQGWIVEVRDCTTEDWPARVYRGTDGSYIRSVVPEEPCAEEHFSTAAAAEIMWAWLRGALPAGLAAAVPVD